MTKKTTPDVTPAPSRTAAATAARMRKSEGKWAAHLRGRGWIVLPPNVLERLGVNPDDIPSSRDWARGFNDGVSAVSEVSAEIHDVYDE